MQFAGELRCGEKTKDQKYDGYKGYCRESVAKQHRIVVSAIMIWTKAIKSVKRIKWWKLKRLESEE